MCFVSTPIRNQDTIFNRQRGYYKIWINTIWNIEYVQMEIKMKNNLMIMFITPFAISLFIHNVYPTEIQSELDNTHSKDQRFNLLTEQGRREYMYKVTEDFDKEIQELKNIGFKEEIVQNHLGMVIQSNLESLETEYSKTGKETLNLGGSSDKYQLRISALCTIAARERYVESITMLRNHIGLCTRIEIPFNFKHIGSQSSPTLKDYPVLNLALELGKNSIPYLKETILCTDINNRNRLIAYAALNHVDTTEATAIENTFRESLDEQGRKMLEEYLKKPVVQPWEFLNRGKTDRMKKKGSRSENM